MRHIKRFVKIMIVMIVMLVLLTTPVMAEGAGTNQDVPANDVVTDGAADSAPDGTGDVGASGDTVESDTVIEEENVTVIARVYEWAMENYDKIITSILGASMSIYALYQKGKNGTLINGIVKVLKSQNGVEAASNNSTEAMNRLEAKQTQLNEYYEQYAKNEEERNKVTAALLVEVMSLIEIQHIAYINNSSIPQSMKNLMTSKYARCLSVINDDTEIKAAYDEMRATLRLTEERTDEKTAA